MTDDAGPPHSWWLPGDPLEQSHQRTAVRMLSRVGSRRDVVIDARIGCFGLVLGHCDNPHSSLPTPTRRTDILVDVPRQHVERYVAPQHQRVVERLHVERRAERGLRLLALPEDLGVTQLVAAGL